MGMGATILDGATVSTCSSAHFGFPPCLRSVGAKSPKYHSSNSSDVNDCLRSVGAKSPKYYSFSSLDVNDCLRSVGAKSPKYHSSNSSDVIDCAAYCSSNIIVHRFGRSYDFCSVLMLTGWPHRIVLSSLE